MIYPSQFPLEDDTTLDNPERLVYEALHGVPDGCDVFYSRRFKAARSGEKEDYEVDFIIIDPRRGCLLLEVKGGLIGYDGETDRWTQNGDPLKKSPVVQVLEYWKSILARYPVLAAKLPVTWALCFPQCERQRGEKLPNAVTEAVIIDERDLPTIEKRIVSLLNAGKRKFPALPGLTKEEYAAVKATLLQGLGMTRRLGTRIERESGMWLKLTSRQYEAFGKALDGDPLVVNGGAGSGKTIIATMLARARLAEGKRVLFLCYNSPLAQVLRDTMADLGADRLFCGEFFHFAKHVIGDDAWWGGHQHNEEFYEVTAPGKLETITPKPADRFDALIIDEGQDFRQCWFEVLESWVKPGGQIVVFLDRKQDLFGHFTRLSKGRHYQKFPLSHNCRNGRAIVEFLNKECDADLLTNPDQPAGEVRIRTCRNPTDQMKMLESEIADLVKQHGLAPGQIVILIHSDKRESLLAGVKTLAGHELVSSYRPIECKPDQLRYAQINIFKGLEADAVILADTHLIPADKYKPTLYVEASRARHLLIIYRQK